MGCARRMNDQRFGIADVRQVREELDMANQLLTRLKTTLNAEANDRTIATMSEVLRSKLILRMALQAWIVHPAHGGMFL